MTNVGAAPADAPIPVSAWGQVPQAKLRRLATVNITSGTLTAVDMDSTDFDNGVALAGAAHWSAANPTRLTFRVAGRYLVGGALVWQIPNNNAAYSLRQGGVRWTSGATVRMVALDKRDAVNTIASHRPGHSCVVPIAVAVGDYIELAVRQDSGVTLFLTAENGLWAVWMGP